MLGADKKRLSKRHAATSLAEYKDDGYLDSAILNTLARLGWSRGEKEVFYLEDLIKDFEITEVQKAGAIFDLTKLDFLNSQHMANLSREEFISAINPFLNDLDIDINDHPKKDFLIESMRSSSNTLKGVSKNLVCYFKEIDAYDDKAIEKFIGSNHVIIQDLKNKIANGEDITKEESAINILIFQCIFMSLFTFIIAYFNWELPSSDQLMLLFLSALFGNVFHLMINHSFKIADLTLTAPFRYSVLICGSLFGFLFFNEIPDFFTWIGGTIIFLSILILTYYESKND